MKLAAVSCILVLALLSVEGAPRSYRYEAYAKALRGKRQAVVATATPSTISNCDKDADWPVQCATCPDNSVMQKDGLACLPCDQFCMTCTQDMSADAVVGSTMCSACLTGYILEADTANNNKSTCFSCASFCNKCSKKAECDVDGCVAKSSGQGTVFNVADNKCDSCATNCKSCSEANKCSAGQCFDRYALNPVTSLCDTCPIFSLTCEYSGLLNNAKTCMDNYALKPAEGTTAASCEVCPGNCKKCSWSTTNSRTECDSSQCSDRYINNAADGQCQACGNNCKVCSVSGTCDSDQCDNGFGYKATVGASTGSCEACPAKCDSCTPDAVSGNMDTCDKCSLQYTLAAEPTCDFCPANCMTCTMTTSGTKCTSSGCESGYAYNSGAGTCHKCPDNCNTCTYTGGITKCTSSGCKSEYATGNDGKCYKCPDMCSQCTDSAAGETKCTFNFCKTGSAYKAVDMTCPACPSDCATCYVDQSENVKCSKCNSAFVRATDMMSCLACPSNCMMCEFSATSGSTICMDRQCSSGYYRITSSTSSHGSCEACDSGCKRCELDAAGQKYCVECDANYVKDQDASPNTCYFCSNCVGTCTWNSGSSQAECSECTGGYTLSSTKQCRSCPTGCKTCTTDDTTQTCSSGGCDLGFAQNDIERCMECPTGCATCSWTSSGSNKNRVTCGTCKSSFVKTNSQCLPCPDQCTSCSYSQDSKDSKNTCNACASGYKLDNGLCKACQSGCTGCNTNGANKCDNGFCPSGWVFNAGTNLCESCASSCTSCTTKNTCDGSGSCATGYMKKSDLSGCTKCSTNCDSCTDAGCTSCGSGSALNSGATPPVCINCPNGCEFCTVVAGSAVCDWGQCNAGSVMSPDGQCKACPNGCGVCDYDTVSSQTVCVTAKCKTGFAQKASDMSCVACPTNCLHCTESGGVTSCNANGCNDNLYQDTTTGSCSACDANCIGGCQASGAGKCDSTCAENYLLTSSKLCTLCTALNCSTCGNSPLVCLTCVNPNEAIIGGDCTACDANCLDADGCTVAAKCTSTCKPGYVQESGDCSACTSTPGGSACTASTSCSTCTTCPSGKHNCATCPDGSTKNTATNGCFACNKTNCKTCDVNFETRCDTCNNGYGQDGSLGCASCVDTNCTMCTSDKDACTTCANGFRVSDANCAGGVCCEECDTKADGCVECSGTKATCTKCDPAQDLFLNDGKCKKICTSANAGKKIKITTPGSSETYTCEAIGDSGCLLAKHSGSTSTASSTCLDGYCMPGYVFNGASCTACSGSCRSCYWDTASSTAKCLFSGCGQGYARKSDGKCEACPTGCTECEESGSTIVCKASKCASNYQKVVGGNTCAVCPIGCDQCGLNTATNQIVCTSGQCSNQYTQLTSDFSCFPCPNFCNECAYQTTDSTGTTGVSQSKCNSNKCISTYAMNSADLSCNNCPTNCGQCTYSSSSSSTVCDTEKCDNGYGQNPTDKTCIGCPTNCDICMYDSAAPNSVKCLDGACQNSYMATMVNGYLDCQTNCISNCDNCMVPSGSLSNICLDQQCSVAYGRTPLGACESCSTGCNYCNIAADGTQTCTICAMGYVLNAGICEACPANCNQCTFDSVNKITICNSGNCAAGFAMDTSLNDNGCLACPDKCSQCTYVSTSSFTGTQCVDGKCDVSTGYAIKAADGSCGACSTNCITCTTAGPDKCDTCNTGYRVSADKLCEQCSSSCSKCASAGKGKCDANSCDSRYTLDANKECKACTSSCFKCDAGGPGLCDLNKCDAEYVYTATTQKCLKCPDKCTECTVNADGVTTECIDKKCYSGYGRKSTDLKCHACPNNCLTCEDKIDPVTGLNKGTLECTACSSAFILNSGVCGACPINCKSCNYVNEFGLQCDTCMDKYTFDSSKNCLACPAWCSECSYDATSSSTKCMAGKCDSGYAMAADGSCKTCGVNAYSNCAMCSDITATNGTASVSTCMECASGYTMQDDKMACVSCQISSTSNCATCMDKPGKFCETCSTTYLQSEDMETCGYECHKCVGPTCEMFSATAAGMSTEVCEACWVRGTKTAAGATVIVRGCSNSTMCSGTYMDEFCQDANGITQCDRCCVGAKCNTFNLSKLDGGAGALKVSALTMLMAAILAAIFNQ